MPLVCEVHCMAEERILLELSQNFDRWLLETKDALRCLPASFTHALPTLRAGAELVFRAIWHPL